MKTKTKVIILVAVAVIAIIATLTYAWVFRKASDNVANQAVAVKIEAVDLVDAFMKDENTANEKYLGKVILIHGTIDSFEENQSENKISLTIKEVNAISGVICEFAKGNTDTALLKQGRVIKIKGLCSGFLMDVVLTKCSIEE